MNRVPHLDPDAVGTRCAAVLHIEHPKQVIDHPLAGHPTRRIPETPLANGEGIGHNGRRIRFALAASQFRSDSCGIMFSGKVAMDIYNLVSFVGLFIIV